MTVILGISAYYHDSAAALVKEGRLVAAAQEERFTRKKHDERFPKHALDFCLGAGGLRPQDVDYVVFYEKPWVKFERLLETYLGYAPQGLKSFIAAMPSWLKEKLFLKEILKKELAQVWALKASDVPPLLFTEHHQSHAASAFFPSPFQRAAVLCMDGVGEWATTSLWLGEGNKMQPQWEIRFPHSLGLLYTAFTYYTGFKVNSGEYKLMGLAPYGEPRYVQTILDHFIDLKEDGSFRLNMEYFNYATGLTMTNAKFDQILGGPPRKPEDPVTQRDMDLARSIQVVTEEAVLRLGKNIRKETGEKNLCLAGGVALNCVANGRLLRESVFEKLWIQPASGDAGGAIGAALAAWYQHLGRDRHPEGQDAMLGSYLGPSFSNAEIQQSLEGLGAVFHRHHDQTLFPHVAGLLAEENVVGWFQGAMEFGPRALGNRSILGDPRSEKMQSVMNLKIKFRESFRPFAPSVLAEKVQECFELQEPSPYMMLVAPVKESLRLPINKEQESLFGIEKLKVARSKIPAITHVDYSARVQTVHPQTNPRYYELIKAFDQKTGCPVLINTSFNVRGEPIVCSPEDAYRCFMRTEMDYLVLENFVLAKQDQPRENLEKYGRDTFELD